MLWRRSYDTPPPPLADDAEFSQVGRPALRRPAARALPRTECLEATSSTGCCRTGTTPSCRTSRAGVVLVAAHGNSLRALIKHLDGMSDEASSALNVPTGIPLHYDPGVGGEPPAGRPAARHRPDLVTGPRGPGGGLDGGAGGHGVEAPGRHAAAPAAARAPSTTERRRDLAVALADQREGVGRVGVVGEQEVERVVHGTGRGRSAGSRTGGGAGHRVRVEEAAAHGEVGVADRRRRDPSRSATSPGCSPQAPAAASQGALQWGGGPHHGDEGSDHGLVGSFVAPVDADAVGRPGAAAGRGEGPASSASARGGTREALVEQPTPLAVQLGQHVGGDPPSRGLVEGDELRHRLEPPSGRARSRGSPRRR